MADTEVSLAGKRCLVLDDEFLIALDIQQILESAGAEVVCAGNGADALMAIRDTEKFDLAVLDLMLSGAMRTSLVVASVLIEQRTPFIFLTGMRAQDLKLTAQFPEAPVVEKPYQAPLLLQAVGRALKAR